MTPEGLLRALMNGLTFHERIPVLSPIEFDPLRQQQRSQLWRNPDGITGGMAVSTDRWVESGLSARSLVLLQGETGESLMQRVPTPAWCHTIQQASARWSSSRPTATDEVADFGPPLTPFRFIIDFVVDRTRIRLDAIDWTPSGKAVIGDGLNGLLAQMVPHPVLIDAVSQACVLELQLAEQEGSIVGATGQERVDRFFDTFSEVSRCLEFLSFYPALARCVVTTLEQWSSAVCEFFERLNSDAENLMRTFDISGGLSSIHWEAGDRHDGGRSVATLVFASNQRILYKPRSMSVDIVVGDVVERINHSSTIELRVPRALDRHEYGWAEFIEQEPCISVSDARQFFRRHGALLATLHLFGASDMHFENVVAAGPFPICVDLETIFLPRARNMVDSVESVLAVGLLPQRVSIRDHGGTRWLDVSGLTGGEGMSRELSRESTARPRGHVSVGRNRARSPSGEMYRAEDYSDEIIEGFCRGYRTAKSLNDRLAFDSSIEERVAESTMRIVLRPTMVYLRLLSESWHPDLLQDGLDRSFYWEALSQLPLDPSITRDERQRILDYETCCLEQADVPVFRCKGDDRHLRRGDGRILVRDFSLESAVEAFRRRLAEATPRRMRDGVTMIQTSLQPSSERS